MSAGLNKLMPKVRKALVGEKTLEVRQMTAAKQSAVLKTIVKGLDLRRMLEPFMMADDLPKPELPEDEAAAKKILDEYEDKVRRARIVRLIEALPNLQGTILKLATDDMRTVIQIVLDTPANRADLMGADVEIKIDVHPEYGYRYCPAMFEAIEDTITDDQMVDVFETMVEITDIMNLGKKWASAVAKIWNATAGKADQSPNS